MKRYVVMERKGNGRMVIIANKATKKEAEAVKGTSCIIKTVNLTKRKKRKSKAKKKK